MRGRIHHIFRSLAIGSALGALSFLWPSQLSRAQVGPPPQAPAPAVEQVTNDAIEPLASGPIHEAFANPLQYDASKPLIVSQQPPDLIEEVSPEVKPEGENVIWIPG